MKRANLTHDIHVRLSAEDYADLHERFKASDRWSLPDFIRHLLFNRPVTVKYRSRSAEEFMELAIGLKNSLDIAIKAGSTEATEETVKEIKALMHKIHQVWSSE